MRKISTAAVLLVIVSTSQMVLANPAVKSREYKLMLDASKFHYASEQSDVLALMSDVKPAIEAAINRNVSGTAQLEYQRQVAFFDTPHSCELNHLGYNFRERIDNGQSEVTLKFRSPDRYISDFEDVSSSTSGAETKLEADIGATSTNDFKVVYGHSTTVPNTRTINNAKDINVYFNGFKKNYGLNDHLALAMVSGLTIQEHVYKDVYIDLGAFDAKLSVTLWYQGVPTNYDTPLVAEISFKYKDSAANYSAKVVNRARQSFNAIRSLSNWVDPVSLTKTRFVYQYDPSFCNP